MNTKYLEYVIEINKCGSINKAAQNLFLSQPNLSNSIKNLEDELGFHVFVRTNSGVELTREGEFFIKSAKKVISEVNTINQIPTLFSKKQNLSISSSYYSDFMHQLICFKEKYPPPSKEDLFKETGLIQTIQDVIEQRYRMCLFYCFDQMCEKYYNIAKQYDLEMISISTKIPAVLLVSANNPLSKKKSVSLVDIQRYKLAMFENFEFEDWLGILGLHSDNKVLYIFDRGGLIDTVKQGNYVSVIINPSQSLRSNGCVYLPIEDLDFKLNIFLLHKAAYTMNHREKLFVKQLKNHFNQS